MTNGAFVICHAAFQPRSFVLVLVQKRHQCCSGADGQRRLRLARAAAWHRSGADHGTTLRAPASTVVIGTVIDSRMMMNTTCSCGPRVSAPKNRRSMRRSRTTRRPRRPARACMRCTDPHPHQTPGSAQREHGAGQQQDGGDDFDPEEGCLWSLEVHLPRNSLASPPGDETGRSAARLRSTCCWCSASRVGDQHADDVDPRSSASTRSCAGAAQHAPQGQQHGEAVGDQRDGDGVG